jgi:hypothetical protein
VILYRKRHNPSTKIDRRSLIVGAAAVVAASAVPASATPSIYVGMRRPPGTLRIGQAMDFVSEDPLTGVRYLHRVVVTRIRWPKRDSWWFELEGVGDAVAVGENERLGLRGR